MKLSVIIPTCHRPETLDACLACLAPGAQTLGADHYEVIVSDDGAPAGSVQARLAERFPWARWVEGPRRGPAANRNRGSEAATGEVLVFFDDDCLPESAVLAAYAAHFGGLQSTDAAEGRITADRERRRLDDDAPINESGGLFWSCNIAIRAVVFRKLGGFDERFPHAAMEDVELRQRLRRNGVKIVFVPQAAVMHPLRRLGGWPAIRRRAAAHGLYVRMERTHMAPYTLAQAVERFARTWGRGILPQLWRYRGRGLWRRAQYSLLPFLCAWEMRRAMRLPTLPEWKPMPGAKELSK